MGQLLFTFFPFFSPFDVFSAPPTFSFFVQNLNVPKFCLQTKAKAYFLLFISLEQQIDAENTD